MRGQFAHVRAALVSTELVSARTSGLITSVLVEFGRSLSEVIDR